MISRELIEKLSIITEEEQEILNGKKDIQRKIYMDKDRNIINSGKLLEAGKLITVRPHTRFVHFPEHSHDFIEVIYMCQGKTTHIINGNEIILKEGELLFLGQNAKQEIMPAGRNDIAVNFIILPEFFDSPLAMLINEESQLKNFIIDSLRVRGENSCYMYFQVADAMTVQNLVENLIATLTGESQNKRKISSVTMGLLFLELVNYTHCLAYQNEQERTVIKTLKYIDENYRDGSLTELSGELHYDFYWFSREIKKKTGKTYTQLLQEKRLMQACFLLKNTNISISDIAARVGYENVSYFYRLFRKYFHMSPRQYRTTE